MADIPTPDVVALVRRRYVEGALVSAIVAESGVRTRHIMYRCLAGEYPDGSGAAPAPIPRRRPAVRSYRRAASRVALVGSIWRTAQKQVEHIEDRLDAAGLPLAERESNARMLAVVARTLRELAAVDEANKPRKNNPKNDDDELPPRNVDELRQALSRKLEAFIARSGDGVSDDAG